MSNLFSVIRAANPEQSRHLLTTETGRRMTYGDLFRETGRFANALVSLGVKPGDRVAVQIDKSPEALVLYLACIRSGAVLLPLNTGYTLGEVEYFLRDAEPSLVVVAPARHHEVEALCAQLGIGACESLGTDCDGSLAEIVDLYDSAFTDVERGGDDLAAILYTSGTTGRSKGAMLTHHNLLSNADTLVEYWRFSKDDVLLHALPVFHTHGLFVAINTALMAGSSLIFLSKFDVGDVLHHLPRATCMMGVPTFMSASCNRKA